MNCLFNEPWVGPCNKETSSPAKMCCTKHEQEKCQVCGEQATTRCQASIGMMCGIPLCSQCGAGEMCLHHASRGPLHVIRTLLGAGPIISMFATQKILVEKAEKMKALAERLRKMDIGPSMLSLEVAKQKWKDEGSI